jgi:hypothetical protein
MNQRLLAADAVGEVANPWGVLNPNYPAESGAGLVTLLNNLLKTAIVISGIWALINIIVAGYEFISAEGNPEKITKAWNKIWQSLLGVLIVAGSLVLAAIFGQIIFGDPTAIINPRIYGPGG